MTESSNVYYIYSLRDPLSMETRYIGMSTRPDIRFKEHLKCEDVCHRTNWIRSVLDSGLQPVMKLIDEVDSKEEAFELEKAYIRDYKLLKVNLTNSTIGGEAPMIGKKHTILTRQRMSESRTGEQNHFYGKKHSEESRKKMSEALNGRVSWNKGKKLSEEHRAHLRKPKSTPAYNKGKTRFDLALMEEMLQSGMSQTEVGWYFKTDQGTISKCIKKYNLKINNYANA